MSKVSVIIANKNSGTQLGVCIRNLSEIKEKYFQNLEVIVVDRQSTDNSMEEVKKSFDWVQVIENEDNGLSYANNIGTKRATGEYLLFLDPSAYPRLQTIGGMVEYMDKHPDVGLATPKLYLEKGNLDPDAHRSFPTPWNSFTRLTGLWKLFPKSKLFNSYFMWVEDLDKEHEIDACVYGFMLVRKALFDEIGGFDLDYYMHGEDLDLCYRIKKTGAKIMYLPQFESGRYMKRIDDKKTKATLKEKLVFTRSSTNAMRMFLKKNYRKKYFAPLLWFMNLATYLLEILRVAKTLVRHIFK